MTSKVYPYKIKDTERTIQITKVSPLLIRQLNKSYPQPEPPKNKVKDIQGNEVEEINLADPAYEAALREHRFKLSEMSNELLIERGVIVELTADDKAEVKELRKFWKEKYAKELEGSDKFVFINYICLGTGEDIKELVEAITKRSFATAEGTQEALTSFPDKA